MNVLLLNHTAQVSGAERVLLTLISNLPDEVRAHVACPPGPLADAGHEFGVPVHGVPGTVGSLKLHPLHTPRAVVDIARSAFALRRIAREVEADVVHANSVRAGLIAVLAAALGAPRPLVHLHDRLPA